MNKAQKIEKSLGWTPTECGKKILGHPVNPYRAWHNLTSSGKWHKSTDRYFDLILALIESKNGRKYLKNL